MKDISQPVFWLDVRKEYIIQNFDKMLSYLELYNYSADGENGDFDKTFTCLKDFVNEIFHETSGSDLCRLIPYNDLDDELIVRIVAAYLLVCQKIGNNDVHCLSMLANRLLLMDVLKLNEVVEKFRKLQFNCMRGCNVSKYCFTWSDLKKDNADFSFNMFCYNLANTEFSEPEESKSLYYENKGVVVLEEDRLRVAPMNYREYTRNELQLQLALTDDMEICVERKGKKKTDTFAKLFELNSLLMFQQNAVKPSPVKILKTYDIGDTQQEVIVRVTQMDFNIYAVTTDPDYKPLKGYIYIPAVMHDVMADYFKQQVRIGDLIKVHVQNNAKIPFTIADTFEEYYEETTRKSMRTIMSAVYHSDYRLGRKWLTENGLIVNIRDDGKDELVRSAVDNGTPMSVRITDNTKDKNGIFVISGNYELYSLNYTEDKSLDEFKESARNSLVYGFLDWSEDDYVDDGCEDEVSARKVSAGYFLPLAYVFYKRANMCYISTEKRLQNLIAARMIAQICGAEEDNMFITHEINYLSSIVSFAQGDATDLKLTHDGCLDGNIDVERRENIVSVLSGYKQYSGSYSLHEDDEDEDVLLKLNDLVQASNILLNYISGQEINRIKKNIAATLGVADMFKNNENASTYYGEENDSLEFKSSIVFPPVNKRQNQNVPAELTRQKWEILKAVCGFLNSMSGGEILLGVRDDGYSCGLKDDLDYLYKNRKIAEPTMDKLMLYVKYAVDEAFCDDCGLASTPKDITHARVRYVSDKNKENNEVLRIQVQPYEYGVVEFKDKKLLPEGMSSAYQRSSNTTSALTSETKRQLRDSKLSGRADADTQKIIDLQRAKKDKKVVTLRGYISRNGMKDRNVEPYKILLDRKAVICYDVDKKEPREYKITRFSDVVVTNRNWKYYREKYENLRVDLFDMLEGDEPPVNIVLKLGALPYNLLLEECNGAEFYVHENKDADKDEYPWIMDADFYNISGIGRFYLGLAYYIKIVKGEELKAYVRDYIENLKM